MNELQLERLKQAAHPVIQVLTEKLIWQPDPRFDAMVAEIPKPLLDQVKAQLSEAFSNHWDKKSIRKAPQTVRRGAGLFAQMENNQLLFSDFGPSTEVDVMAAWWPWGPGAPASLRLFVSDVPATPESKSLIDKFKSWLQ